MPTSATRARPTRASGAGFTLVELLVVLAILAIAFAIVTPSVTRAIGATGPASVTEELAVALREARSNSIVSTTPVRVTLEAGARRWKAGTREGTWPDGVAVELVPAPQGGEAIVFYPDGTASGGRLFVGSGSSRRILAVDWLTGRVTTPAS